MRNDWDALLKCKDTLAESGPDDRAKVVAFHKLRWLCAAKMSAEAHENVRWVLELVPKTYSDDGRRALLEVFEVLKIKSSDPTRYTDAIRAQRGSSMVQHQLEKEFNNGEPVDSLFYQARAWLAFEIAERSLGSDEIAESMPYEYSDEAAALLVGVGYFVEHMSGE